MSETSMSAVALPARILAASYCTPRNRRHQQLLQEPELALPDD